MCIGAYHENVDEENILYMAESVVLYTLDLQKQEHVMVNGGYVFRFNLRDGKFKGASANMLNVNLREVDAISVLQQGTSCEVAENVNREFRKRTAFVSEFQAWFAQRRLQPIATLTLKRKVGTQVCFHTVYVFNRNTLGMGKLFV